MSVGCSDFGLFEKMENTGLKIDIRLGSMTQKGVFMLVLPLWTHLAYKISKNANCTPVKSTKCVKYVDLIIYNVL